MMEPVRRDTHTNVGSLSSNTSYGIHNLFNNYSTAVTTRILTCLQPRYGDGYVSHLLGGVKLANTQAFPYPSMPPALT